MLLLKVHLNLPDGLIKFLSTYLLQLGLLDELLDQLLPALGPRCPPLIVPCLLPQETPAAAEVGPGELRCGGGQEIERLQIISRSIYGLLHLGVLYSEEEMTWSSGWHSNQRGALQVLLPAWLAHLQEPHN